MSNAFARMSTATARHRNYLALEHKWASRSSIRNEYDEEDKPIVMKRLCLLAVLLLVTQVASAEDSDGDGYDDEVDHRDDVDAVVILSLVDWNANTSEQWDSDESAPDPWFEVCVDADEVRVECFDSDVWENTFELNHVNWNRTVNIPDDSSLITFTIECRDKDIANDDECDMNSESGKWKLVFIFDWLSNPSANYSGSGFGDDEVESRNAASNWTVLSPSTVDEVEEIPDTDGDGYDDDTDAFITDPTQWSDFDGDGFGDNQSGNNPDIFIAESTQWADRDGDGFGDNALGNNADAFPDEPTQHSDEDQDGYGDNPLGVNPDLCRNSPPEPVDNEGCTESQKVDSDGDGVLDISDQCSNTMENESVDATGCPVAQGEAGGKSFIQKFGFGWVFSLIAAIISISLATIVYNAKKKRMQEEETSNMDMHSDIKDIKKEVEHTEEVVEAISERL